MKIRMDVKCAGRACLLIQCSEQDLSEDRDRDNLKMLLGAIQHLFLKSFSAE